MTEKEMEVKLPSTDELHTAYEKLFGNDKDDVRRFKPSGVRYIDLPGKLIIVEQNSDKESHWAKLAREGHKVAWVMKDGDYLARIVDGKVDILNHE
jgi:hypothetical protein